MAISWLIFAVPAVLFAYRGYRRGIWSAATRLLSLLGAYIVALLFANRLVPVIESATVLEGMAAYMSAGLLLFLLSALALSLVFLLLSKLLGQSRVPSKPSALAGAIMGAGIGAVVGLVAVFGLSYLMEIWPGAGVSLRDRPPTAIERLARYSANKLTAWISSFGDVEPLTAKVSAAMVSEPRKVISHLQNLQQKQTLQTLFSEPENQAALRSGDTGRIQQLPAFQQLLQDPDLQGLLQTSGIEILDADREQALAQQVSQLWRRSEQIKTDSRVRAILEKPEFQQQLKSGNPAALLNNKDFMTILNILLHEAPPPVELQESQNNQNTPNTEPAIYRWVDAEGNVHYGDRPPEAAPTTPQ